jgi:predicted CXXCH cytochrome family protein
VIETPGIGIRIGWEAAQGAGVLAVLGCLLLCVLPVRPRHFASAPLSLRRHEIVGWTALGAAALHVVLLLALDPGVIEHVKRTAPLYEWAGILAAAMLLWLTAPSSAAVRRRLWSRHRSFQALHVGVTCFLVAAIAVHVITTDRYAHRGVRAFLFLAFSAVALLALLRTRMPLTPAHRPLPLLNRLAFGRHSALVLACAVVAIVALAALLAPGAALALREPVITRLSPLAVDFPHDKHRRVRCVQCHHNFTDRSGDGGCYSCHRSGRPDLRAGAEARFHDFCLGCHRDPPPQETHHGPVTGCDTCHLPPHA